jgi:hypothetical protein
MIDKEGNKNKKLNFETIHTSREIKFSSFLRVTYYLK